MRLRITFFVAGACNINTLAILTTNLSRRAAVGRASSHLSSKDADGARVNAHEHARTMKLGKNAKNAYIAFLRQSIVDDEAFAQKLIKCSREYTSWARALRERGRAESAHVEATRLLDSKGHMLNVCDRMCERVSGEEDSETMLKVREAWDATKTKQRAKFERAGGREGVAEAKIRAREAKERVKANQRERESREERDKAKKAARLEYATKVHEARSSGACLDWLNMGRCRFGEECQFEHDAMSKGILKQLAIDIGAETGDVKREKNREEKEERKARARALRAQNAEALGGYSSSSDGDDDGDGDEDLPGFLKADRAKRAAQALLATNKTKEDMRREKAATKKTKDAGKAANTAKKTKHFNEKQLERKAKFLKDAKNQPFVKRGMKRPASEEKSPSKKKPRHKDSARKTKRVGIARTKFD